MLAAARAGVLTSTHSTCGRFGTTARRRFFCVSWLSLLPLPYSFGDVCLLADGLVLVSAAFNISRNNIWLDSLLWLFGVVRYLAI